MARKHAFALILTAAAGCGPTTAPPPAAPPTKFTTASKDAPDDHEHGGGPHGGTIMDFGKYHAEFTVDHGKKEATVYVLGGDAKTAAPVAAEGLTLSVKSPAFQAELKASPLPGEPAGKSSRYVASHELLGKEQEFAGSVAGKVEGKPVLGEFAEEPHAGHDHKGAKK